MASPISRKLFLHSVERAAALPRESAGNNRLARTAMIAITTSSSIRVKARLSTRSAAALVALIGAHADANPGRDDVRTEMV